MAKYPHRVFEMFESRAEASVALRKSPSCTSLDKKVLDSWKFRYLIVAISGDLMHVRFDESLGSEDFDVEDLRRDLGNLADKVERDCRILLDFEGVKSFDPNSVEALAEFKRKLRIRGSRMVLCGVEEEPRKSFFVS